MTAATLDATSELAQRLTKGSRKLLWDVYSYFDWPDSLGEDFWAMSPELVSLYGTDAWDRLSEAQQKRLSLYELGNFFSLT